MGASQEVEAHTRAGDVEAHAQTSEAKARTQAKGVEAGEIIGDQ